MTTLNTSTSSVALVPPSSLLGLSQSLTTSQQTQISKEESTTRDRDQNKQAEQSNLKGTEYSMLDNYKQKRLLQTSPET